MDKQVIVFEYPIQVKGESSLSHNFGISISNNSTVVIFNTNYPFRTLHTVTIPDNVNPLGVAVTPNCKRAIVTLFSAQELIQIDPVKGTIMDTVQTPTTFPEGVSITPNGLFAVSTDGKGKDDIISYSLRANAIVTSLAPPDDNGLQAVAISPNGDGLVLAARTFNNSIRVYNIDRTGTLIDTGNDIIVGTGAVGTGPVNITFTPNGNFAFVVGRNNEVVVLETKNPNEISVVNTVPLQDGSSAQTVVVSEDGKKVYVLSDTAVNVYCFDHCCKRYLTPSRFFKHNLFINSYYGVRQMALDPQERYLFISGSRVPGTGVLEVFTVSGDDKGPVPGIQPVFEGNTGAGVATCGSAYLRD